MIFFEKLFKSELMGLFDQDLGLSVRVQLVKFGDSCLNAPFLHLSVYCKFLGEAVHAVGSHFFYGDC